MLAALVAGLLSPAFSAEAADALPKCGHCQGGNGGDGGNTGAVAGDHGIDIHHSEPVTGRGDGSYGPAPGRTTWREIEEDMTPTCWANSRQGADALCGAAVNTCPGGLIRFWVWHRVLEYTKQNGQTTSRVLRDWYQEDGTFCLGADDPQVPTIAKVIDQVRTDFAHLPLVAAQVQSDPGPTTIVNMDTAFSAGSTQPQTFDPVLLGVTVHVTAKPVEWDWTWGDGTTSVTTTPGVPKQPVVTHEYKRVTDAPVSVVVKFAGTFSVGADPTQFDIQQPAFSPPSAPVMVRVREARSELVSH
ncbi:MAG: hypothetical protein QOJ79_384 [Actinomycetota bacterium]|nr:hypothetical protein [Actinomycetota bacterium]